MREKGPCREKVSGFTASTHVDDFTSTFLRCFCGSCALLEHRPQCKLSLLNCHQVQSSRKQRSITFKIMQCNFTKVTLVQYELIPNNANLTAHWIQEEQIVFSDSLLVAMCHWKAIASLSELPTVYESIDSESITEASNRSTIQASYKLCFLL